MNGKGINDKLRSLVEDKKTVYDLLIDKCKNISKEQLLKLFSELLSAIYYEEKNLAIAIANNGNIELASMFAKVLEKCVNDIDNTADQILSANQVK